MEEKLIEQIQQKKAQLISMEWYQKIKGNWDAIAKPLDSMGKFEHYLSLIGAIQHNSNPQTDKTALLVFASDNGVVAEGISQSDQSVTAICAKNIANGLTSVCSMAKVNDVEIVAIDVGVNAANKIKGMRDCRVRQGTRNFANERAMTREETLQAMDVGFSFVREYKERGYAMLGVGEIGIGNTTTSSAVAAAILQCKASEVTGKGAGLSDAGLQRKIAVIDQAIEKYQLYGEEPLTILAAVGGFDLAAMVGAYIGAATFGMPIVLDGFISLVAALTAEMILPGVKEYLIPSHRSKEPGCLRVMERLQVEPVLQADMALGEGTGAVMMISLLKTANEVYKKSCQFQQTGIDQYTRYV